MNLYSSKRHRHLSIISSLTQLNSWTRKCKACFDLSDVSFSQVSETKLHEVDEKLDEIEQILSLYEAKLESVPEEYFENLPEVPMAEVEENVVARTENPLMVE